jgi:hypothetical protein
MSLQTKEQLHAQIASIKDMYKASSGVHKFHGLVIGEKGSGKTSLFGTCPFPVLIDSWDPGGTSVLQDLIDKGDVVVDNRWEQASPSNPMVAEWEKTFNERGQSGLFAEFGTYGFDSTTTFGQALTWQILKKEGRELPDLSHKMDDKIKGMRIQDWGTYSNAFTMITRSMGSLPCNTVLLGHVGRDVNEATATMIRSIMLPGSSKNYVPINMPEMYVLLTKQTANGVKRKLLTENDGEYLATTRMGGHGVFQKEEEPDIRVLLKKCGFPCEDKPKLS